MPTWQPRTASQSNYPAPENCDRGASLPHTNALFVLATRTSSEDLLGISGVRSGQFRFAPRFSNCGFKNYPKQRSIQSAATLGNAGSLSWRSSPRECLLQFPSLRKADWQLPANPQSSRFAPISELPLRARSRIWLSAEEQTFWFAPIVVIHESNGRSPKQTRTLCRAFNADPVLVFPPSPASGQNASRMTVSETAAEQATAYSGCPASFLRCTAQESLIPPFP
jgi:hypothetical protein